MNKIYYLIFINILFSTFLSNWGQLRAEPIDWWGYVSIGQSETTKESTLTAFFQGFGTTFDFYHSKPNLRSTFPALGLFAQGELENRSSFFQNKNSLPLNMGLIVNVKEIIRIEPGIGTRIIAEDLDSLKAKYKGYFNIHMGIGWYPHQKVLLRISFDKTSRLDLQTIKLSLGIRVYRFLSM